MAAEDAFYMGTVVLDPATADDASSLYNDTLDPAAVADNAFGLLANVRSEAQYQEPYLISVSPSTLSYGETLTITGSELNTAVSVIAGGVSAQFTIVNSTTITAVMPLLTPGPKTVYVVHNKLPQPNVTNDLAFTFILTTITDIVPDPAPLPGGVTIVGTLLNKVTKVYMDGVPTSFRIISPTEIYAGLPMNTRASTIDVHLEYDV